MKLRERLTYGFEFFFLGFFLIYAIINAFHGNWSNFFWGLGYSILIGCITMLLIWVEHLQKEYTVLTEWHRELGSKYVRLLIETQASDASNRLNFIVDSMVKDINKP